MISCDTTPFTLERTHVHPSASPISEYNITVQVGRLNLTHSLFSAMNHSYVQKCASTVYSRTPSSQYPTALK